MQKSFEHYDLDIAERFSRSLAQQRRLEGRLDRTPDARSSTRLRLPIRRVKAGWVFVFGAAIVLIAGSLFARRAE